MAFRPHPCAGKSALSGRTGAMATAGSTLSQLDRAEGSQAFSDALANGNAVRASNLNVAALQVCALALSGPAAGTPRPPSLSRTTALTRARRLTNRIENRVLTTPCPMTACWSSFGLVGRVCGLLMLDRLADTSRTLGRSPGRLTNRRRPSLPLVPMAGPKDGSQ
jgi:hypothetical protein